MPVNIPIIPESFISQITSKLQPIWVSLRFRIFLPMIIPLVNFASIFCLGRIVISYIHFWSLNAIVISRLTIFSLLEIFLISLVPFQNLGSLSRSEIISQTLSIETFRSTETVILPTEDTHNPKILGLVKN